MGKQNYFSVLEKLSEISYSSVSLSLSCSHGKEIKELSELRKSSYLLLYSLEYSLFSDFLPPLERDGIAAYAHSVTRIIDSANEHALLKRSSHCLRRTEEEQICLELAYIIKESTLVLKELKKPGKFPNIRKFRELLHKGHMAHVKEMSAAIALSTSGSAFQMSMSAGKLRSELSLCFDKLLEVMLDNI